MESFSAKDIVANCEHLDFGDRLSFLIKLGRASLNHDALKTTLRSMFESSLYERLLALYTTYGSQDAWLPMRAYNDPSTNVQALAIELLSLMASNDQIQGIIDKLHAKSLLALFPKLRRRKRLALIDALLQYFLDRDQHLFLRFVHYGSQDFIEDKMAHVVPYLKVNGWMRLAKAHPIVAIEHMVKQLAYAGDADFDLTTALNKVVELIANKNQSTSAVLSPVRAYLRFGSLRNIESALQEALNRFPSPTIEVLGGVTEQVRLSWSVAIRKARIDDLLKLHSKRPDLLKNRDFLEEFARLPPDSRLKLYKQFGASWRNDDGSLDSDIIDHLPQAQREVEARRNLQLIQSAFEVGDYARWISCLPWDEAVSLQGKYLESSQADLRAAALSSLVSAAIYQRERASDALDLIAKRPFENDKVRQRMLGALQKWPTAMFAPEKLPSLEKIAQQAMNASDQSRGSLNSIAAVVQTCFDVSPIWSIDWFLKLFMHTRVWTDKEFDLRRLEGEILTHIDDMLSVGVQYFATRKDHHQVTRLMDNFEWRTGSLPKTHAALSDMILQSTSALRPWTCLDILKEGKPASKETVEKLVAKDKSWIKEGEIQNNLSHRCQSLLAPFLAYDAFQGQFDTTGEKQIILFPFSHHRWTPSQQEKYALAIKDYLEAGGNNTWNRDACIRTLPKLHFSDTAVKYLVQLANGDEAAIRDRAIRALAYLDEDKGVPTLIDALRDERARVAIRSLTGSLRRMDPARAFRTLKERESKQITVQKELVRLIGDLGTTEAFNYLLSLVQSSETHIEVRIALMRRLWDYTERMDLSSTFITAVKDPKIDVAIMLMNIDPVGFSNEQQEIMIDMTRAALQHSALEARTAALARCKRYPSMYAHDGGISKLLVDLIRHAKLHEARTAAEALFACTFDKEPGLIASLFEDLLRDKRRLAIAFDLLRDLPLAEPRNAKTVQLLLPILRSDSACVMQYLRLLLKGSSVHELPKAILDTVPSLHAEALMWLINEGKEGLAKDQRPGIDLDSLEQELRLHPNEKCRRVGLCILLMKVGETKEWSDEQLKKLQAYRNDQSELVAGAAAWVFPPDHVFN